MVVLGIESSCDETAAAVVRDGSVLLSNVIASQVKVHEKFGGVVPEIASRKHIEAILPVIIQALEDAGTTLAAIDGIAVTRGPGLIGSLLVGLSAAKAIALARRLPIVGVNHLEGHVAASFLMESPPAFPFVALVVSGGHTTIYRVEGFQRFTVLGQTRDDAAGEAFDKAAKLLEIGYPGGVVIDRIAKQGNRTAIPFPRAMRESLDFSFSGLKTSVRYFLEKNPLLPSSPAGMADLCASVRHAIVGVLLKKTARAVEISGLDRVAVSGGVAANSALREGLQKLCASKGWELHLPSPELATDNAAMMAFAAMHHLRAGKHSSVGLEISPQWQVGKM